MEEVGIAYLCLIHPLRRDEAFKKEIASVLAIASLVSDEVVVGMIEGPSWRERLVGLCMVTFKGPARFFESILRSLRDPRGMAIVPACAVLTVIAREGSFPMSPSFAELIDRNAFDGEVGWSVEKAMHACGLRSAGVEGRGPNYGQIFEDHVELYRWIRSVAEGRSGRFGG